MSYNLIEILLVMIILIGVQSVVPVILGLYFLHKGKTKAAFLSPLILIVFHIFFIMFMLVTVGLMWSGSSYMSTSGFALKFLWTWIQWLLAPLALSYTIIWFRWSRKYRDMPKLRLTTNKQHSKLFMVLIIILLCMIPVLMIASSLYSVFIVILYILKIFLAPVFFILLFLPDDELFMILGMFIGVPIYLYLLSFLISKICLRWFKKPESL